MGTWVSVEVPRFTLTPSAWDIIVDGERCGSDLTRHGLESAVQR